MLFGLIRRRESRRTRTFKLPPTERRIRIKEYGVIDLIAFDPGGTTGWARGYFPDDNLTEHDCDLWEGVEVEYGQLAGPEDEQAVEIDALLAGYCGPVIVESFSLRQFRRDSNLLAPVRIESKIDYIIHLINMARGGDGEISLRKVSQTPAMAKQTGTDERLREVGLYVPGMPHARDAMRHLFTYARRAKGTPEMVWPIGGERNVGR